MTLSDRIAALSAPDRAMDAEIADAIKWWPDQYVRIDIHGRDRRWTREKMGVLSSSIDCPKCTESIDAALTLASPAFQAHVMGEALKLVFDGGFTVGKFTEALAIAICVVALKERGL